MALGASDEQMDYPVMYASAKEGWAVADLKDVPAAAAASGGQRAGTGVKPLLDLIVEKVPHPKGDRSAPFSMLVTVRLFPSPPFSFLSLSFFFFPNTCSFTYYSI